jgi:hypothetical protein
MNPEIGKLYWFIHARDPSISLGFVRRPDNGASVVGGKTGTHQTGHGESYWDKIKEIITQGYIPVEVARELKLLPPNWNAPNLK